MDGLPLHVPNQGPGPEPRHAPCPRSDPGILPLWQNLLNLWNKLDLSSACPIPLTQWPRKSKRTISFHIYFCCSSAVDSIFVPSVSPPHLSPLIPHHFLLSMCPSYMFFRSLAPFSPIIPTDLSFGCSQFLLYFNVSCYISLAPLFCSLVAPYRGDHMVLVFHLLAYFT